MATARLGAEPAKLLENPRLVADHLEPFTDLIRSASSYWERAGALWGATVYVIHRQTRVDGSRRILAYEWLCGDPVTRFAALYRQLGLTWTPRAERFVRASNRDGDQRTYSVNRATAREVDKWKSRLSDDEIEACRRFVEPFDLPYYPGFEPSVASFSGVSHGDLASDAGARP